MPLFSYHFVTVFITVLGKTQMVRKLFHDAYCTSTSIQLLVWHIMYFTPLQTGTCTNKPTYHEICDETEDDIWDEAERDQICQYLRNEERRHTIVATCILMTVDTQGENMEEK